MPPQKRSRNADKGDAEMKDAEAPAPAAAGHAQSHSDSDDSDDDSDDDDDELTFAEQMHDSDEDEDDDEEEEDEAMDGGASKQQKDAARQVNVDFVFLGPARGALPQRQAVPAVVPAVVAAFDVSGLANIVVSQAAVGTMVCVDGEDDVYGFITALGLQRLRQRDERAADRA
ncbi:hypothetical protein PINS_up023639, partial [Pythium insidiosum]